MSQVIHEHLSFGHTTYLMSACGNHSWTQNNRIRELSAREEMHVPAPGSEIHKLLWDHASFENNYFYAQSLKRMKEYSDISAASGIYMSYHQFPVEKTPNKGM